MSRSGLPVGGSGVFGYLILHARNVRQALESVSRYACLVLQNIQVSFDIEGDNAVIHWRWPSSLSVPHYQYASFSVGALIIRLRTASGGDWQPLLVEVEHRELPCHDLTERVLGTTVRYNAPRNAIHIEARLLDRRMKTADSRLFSLVRDLGDRMLAELPARGDIVSTTRNVIRERLESGQVTLESIAEQIEIPPRSLQTKLAQAHTTFEALLNETRQGLAQRYLRDTDLSLTEIAFLLGFSELSAFTRAAQRWFGKSPSALRQQFRQDL